MLYVICQSFLHDSTVVVPGKISLKSHFVMNQQQDANNKKVVFSVFRSKANHVNYTIEMAGFMHLLFKCCKVFSVSFYQCYSIVR